MAQVPVKERTPKQTHSLCSPNGYRQSIHHSHFLFPDTRFPLFTHGRYVFGRCVFGRPDAVCVVMAYLTILLAMHCAWGIARDAEKGVSKHDGSETVQCTPHTHTFYHKCDSLDLPVPGAVPQFWPPTGKSSNPASISCQTLTHIHPSFAIVENIHMYTVTNNMRQVQKSQG